MADKVNTTDFSLDNLPPEVDKAMDDLVRNLILRVIDEHKNGTVKLVQKEVNSG